MSRKIFGEEKSLVCGKEGNILLAEEKKIARNHNSEFILTFLFLPLSKGLEGISDLLCSCSYHREYRRSAPPSSDAEFWTPGRSRQSLRTLASPFLRQSSCQQSSPALVGSSCNMIIITSVERFVTLEMCWRWGWAVGQVSSSLLTVLRALPSPSQSPPDQPDLCWKMTLRGNCPASLLQGL